MTIPWMLNLFHKSFISWNYYIRSLQWMKNLLLNLIWIKLNDSPRLVVVNFNRLFSTSIRMIFSNVTLVWNVFCSCRLVLRCLEQQWYRKCQGVSKSGCLGSSWRPCISPCQTSESLHSDALQNGWVWFFSTNELYERSEYIICNNNNNNIYYFCILFR